ncbi:hypothetical protein [Pseudotabrizicola algicola]|uniref:Uncharacterized protein n=1 Tax=Pseudotabrizicola algicola TaxID=2709381 RepID=A0A6B3RKJ0_9RHOB|nr:hypothetical protein [Pseudotabrizicola algicola]NEX46587.1 hypothetical protein [Pseudotabrizicola algicola]
MTGPRKTPVTHWAGGAAALLFSDGSPQQAAANLTKILKAFPISGEQRRPGLIFANLTNSRNAP